MKLDIDTIEATARKAQEFVRRHEMSWRDYEIGNIPDQELGDHIAQCSPDVVLALVARIRELEKRCHIVESHPPDFMIEGDPLETQVFILKERLLDERHKSYQLECEVAELEEWKEAREAEMYEDMEREP